MSRMITVENLGKRYRLGGMQAAYATLRETLAQAGRSRTREDLWALKDVSFAVDEGEVLGVIGRNGAGKSTLLKITSRVTLPTEGTVSLHGRVGSLLEVGTGFHPELTGRENIFLNGAILGMRKREVRSKFDDIVDFSELEKFIDTPVKRYSSGMYVRLAFAVAAHLEPEILIVDEVLAVGDVGFQRKCLGKMRDVAESGRTILFVSHNMGAVRSLCTRAVWLDEGTVQLDGDVDPVISAYLAMHESGQEGASVELGADEDRDVQLVGVALTDETGRERTVFGCDEDVRLGLRIRVRQRTPGVYAYLEVREGGSPVLVSDSRDSGENPLDDLGLGEHDITVTIPRRHLAAGSYGVYVSFASLAARTGFVLDAPGVVMTFELHDTTTVRGGDRRGYFSTVLAWESVGGGRVAG